MTSYTREQAADFLKCCQETVSTIIASGDLPAAKIGRAYVLLHPGASFHLERID